MSNLLASLINTSGTLNTYSRVLDVVQNNVSNVSTPGYAKQRMDLVSVSFSPYGGSMGGVRAGDLRSARDEYADQAVRRRLATSGEASQTVSSLQGLESGLDIVSNNGIAGAMDQLFQSFSAWGNDPSSTVARQEVMDSASRMAATFRNTAGQIASVRQDTGVQVHDTVDQINELAGELRDLNVEARQSAANDPALDARMHNALEELSGLVDVTATRQEDGSYTVLVGGQIPLVTADKFCPLGAGFGQPAVPVPVYDDAPPHAIVRDSSGADITSLIGGGKLGALLDIHNRVIPQILGDAYQPGDLNRLAQTLADRVNWLLRSGTATGGATAGRGTALFYYDPADPQGAAQSLDVDAAARADLLAPVDPGPPYSANGIALQLAALSTPQNDADKIDGFSYSAFYGQVTSRIGSALNTAREESDYGAQMVAQAKNTRDQVSSVSLDEEAAMIIEFQRAYQAASKMFTVLDQLTQDVVNLIR